MGSVEADKLLIDGGHEWITGKNMIKIKFYVVSVFAVLMFSSCLAEEKNRDRDISSHMETAILGGGCFWCTEAVFERINGVKDVISWLRWR